MTMVKAIVLVFCAIVAAGCGVVEAQDGGWRKGRGTFYGNEPWLWDIHKGSCGYGQLDPNKGTGFDIAALPDVHYEYSNSCGRCYEVKCDPSVFNDNYGNTLDRSNVCYDANTVVKVTISDTCPCTYPDNAFSNKRWCCGDMDHLDLSYFTYDKLADRRWGVIGLLYRPVACDAPAQEVTTGGEGSRLNWLRDHFTSLFGGEQLIQAFDG